MRVSSCLGQLRPAQGGVDRHHPSYELKAPHPRRCLPRAILRLRALLQTNARSIRRLATSTGSWRICNRVLDPQGFLDRLEDLSR
jgi:hypothetical protein